ncbi:hypothetical protein BGY98DRAFT_1091459 [Russula aff. rugulosa BPL654]|nr:hypothetical protein BGY98DRAFT_1091459 [Russula aff. rugulosa BPL654]
MKDTTSAGHLYSSTIAPEAFTAWKGSAEPVYTVLRICGVMRTPFAVKGGGHATNPGFSSTTGVQIAMTRFNQVVVDKTASLVEVGAGLIWDDVYTLGGGYSWKMNKYELPNGTIQTVTSQNEDIWFGLRGGFNNFFQGEVTDPKAAVLPTYNTVGNIPSVEVLMFYDGPERPPGIFDDFFEFLGSFLEFLKFLPSSDPFAGPRAYFSTVSVFQYSTSLLNVLNAIVNETRMDVGGAVSYDVEPFDSGLFSHSNMPSAYPPDRSRVLFPANICFTWTSSSKDTEVAAAILQSTNTIRSAANVEGQNITDVALYGNYALLGTPVEALYGANLPRLKSIRSQVDPNNVMALAGGFKF